MRNELAKRLTQRSDNRDIDMNPEGLTEAQLKAVIPTLTADNLSLLLEIEREYRNRPAVIEAAEVQLSKLAESKEAEPVKEATEEKPKAKAKK